MDEIINHPAAAAEIDLNQLLVDLDQAENRLPVEAIQAARQHRDEIIPLLIEAIRTATARARVGDVPQGHVQFFALFLLAEFRAKQAVPAILEAVSLPGELPFDLFGDAVHEVLSRSLAVLADDRLDAINELIGNRALNVYVRWTTADAYKILLREGRLTRDEAVGCLHDQLRTAIAAKDDDIAGPLVCCLADLAAGEALGDIEEAYRLNLVDESITELSDVRESIARGDAELRRTLEHCFPAGITDTIAELSGWASYQSHDEPVGEDSFDDDESAAGEDFDDYDETMDQAIERVLHVGTLPEDRSGQSVFDRPQPIHRDADRIGRNDPCPCGSGKKYKKCCGARH